ncbi:hypothetical protein VNI00_018474 [Paramarasmius palmivorus]|uniref:Uncharacterized protein n=1 Tax=Paramarasmius palmivorus TaxID=297713 RepID=A0AAW0AX27_9AGAR
MMSVPMSVPQAEIFNNQDVHILRFSGYSIEEALRESSERVIRSQSLGDFTDEMLELDYEVVDGSAVPHVLEQLETFLKPADGPSMLRSAPGSSPQETRHVATAFPPPFSNHLGSQALSPPSPSTPLLPPAPQVPSSSPFSITPVSVTQAPGAGKLTARKLRLARKTEFARARRRQAAQDRDTHNEVEARVVKVAQSSEPVSIRGFNAIDMPSSRPGWVGTKELSKKERGPASKLKDLYWNGKVTVVLLDGLDRIWSILGAPPPNAKDWDELNKGLMEELASYDRNADFNKDDMDNRRSGGNHGLRNDGVSTGGGQPRPGNIAIRGLKNKAAISEGLLGTQVVSLYATYANRLAAESKRVIKELSQNLPGLKFPSHPSPDGGYWAARCINSAGLRETAAVCTLPHTDFGNWAPGWCCVTAIGDYNPDQGGHMVLWNVGLRVRFPPGCSILFPSSVITHSNKPIQAGERQYSIVEFSAGGLFRRVYNGYKTDEELLVGLGQDELKIWGAQRAARWKEEVRMYTKWYELERGDYQGKVLGDESDLSELSDQETDDERPSKKRRI